jgi:hypothetical protein
MTRICIGDKYYGLMRMHAASCPVTHNVDLLLSLVVLRLTFFRIWLATDGLAYRVGLRRLLLRSVVPPMSINFRRVLAGIPLFDRSLSVNSPNSIPFE